MYMQLFQVNKMYIHLLPRTPIEQAVVRAHCQCHHITGRSPFSGRSIMKTLAVLALSLAGVGSAFAANTQTVYQGVSADGQRVKLTISQGGPEVVIRVDRQGELPQPHWTAYIGTGTAAQR
jgi:hypothetical protein